MSNPTSSAPGVPDLGETASNVANTEGSNRGSHLNRNNATERWESAATNNEEEAESVLSVLLGKRYASPTPIFTSFYYIDAIAIAIQATFLGLLALGYLNVVYEVPKLWLEADNNESYPGNPDTTGFGDGKPWWIGVGAASGLVVGILKSYVFKFEEYDGFVEDLLALHAHPADIIKVAVCCMVGLMGGATVGPESGLGAACGGTGVLWARVVNYFCIWIGKKRKDTETTKKGTSVTKNENCSPDASGSEIASSANEQRRQQSKDESMKQKEESKKRTKLFVLAGMVSAFSTILPSPAAAILLCLELPGFYRLTEVHGLHYLRTLSLLALSGTISFLVYTAIEDNTWLGSEAGGTLPGFIHKYDDTDILLALACGAMGAGLALVYMFVAGVVRLIFTKLKNTLDKKIGWNKRIVVVATLGGTLFGILNYAFPLVVGDGSYQMGTVITRGRQIETSVLIISALMNMFAYWISAEAGFVGGIFFPMLFTSTLIGRVIVNETNAGWAITMACSLVTLASAITPMPLAMVILATSTFNLDSNGSIPLLVCTVTANWLFVGLGVPQKLLSASQARQQSQKDQEDHAIKQCSSRNSDAHCRDGSFGCDSDQHNIGKNKEKGSLVESDIPHANVSSSEV